MNFIKNETCYSCGSDVAKAVKDYNDMIGKDFKSKASSGRKKQYICCDKQCSFNLVFYINKRSGKGLALSFPSPKAIGMFLNLEGIVGVAKHKRKCLRSSYLV